VSANCRSCGAPVFWAITERGKRMPVDTEPYAGDSPSGLFVLRGQTIIAVTPDSFPGEPLYRSHFATCPHGKEWRQ